MQIFKLFLYVSAFLTVSVGVVKAQTVEVNGNGAGSTNIVSVEASCQNLVEQKNLVMVVNSVSSTANTGGNQANANTGGSVTLSTGDSVSDVKVTVNGGDNNALAGGCCGCCAGESTVIVEKNGAKSVNLVTTSKVSVQAVGQKSKTVSDTLVLSKSKTGKNKASKNTGSGVEVKSGDAKSVVDVSVSSGSNSVINP